MNVTFNHRHGNWPGIFPKNILMELPPRVGEEVLFQNEAKDGYENFFVRNLYYKITDDGSVRVEVEVQ